MMLPSPPTTAQDIRVFFALLALGVLVWGWLSWADWAFDDDEEDEP